jgi:uncharacterized protein
MSDKSVLVLYHAGCHDGFCAAWIAHNFYGDAADYVPVNYGDTPPDVTCKTGKTVYILDVSFPRDVLLEMGKKAGVVRVIDHHKSAEEDLRNIPPESNVIATFDMEKSGARLAWEFFMPDHEVPLLVQYIEDRDLWRWKLENSREINAAIRSYPMTFANFTDFNSELKSSSGRTVLVFSGAATLRAQQQIIDTLVSKAAPVNLSGIDGLAVNATCLVSEIAGELAKKASFGATWFDKTNLENNGDYILTQVWSIRTTEESGVDASLIARQYGGGGHKHAAGFKRILRLYG